MTNPEMKVRTRGDIDSKGVKILANRVMRIYSELPSKFPYKYFIKP